MPFEKFRQPEVTDYEKMSEEDLTQTLYRRLDVITGRVLLTGDWKGEDTALSRVFMPEKNGLQVLTELRNDGHEILTILCSGMVSEINLKQAKQLGLPHW